MEEKIKKKLVEKIKSKHVLIGYNSTVRASKNGELEFVVYASNINPGIRSKLENIDVPKYEYDGDSEALSIACGKSFNIAVLGVKK
jgi:ribosomal protein L30E